MVRMWSALLSLIRSMIAASVDDLPDPVGPVTSTIPLLQVHDLQQLAGKCSDSNVAAPCPE